MSYEESHVQEYLLNCKQELHVSVDDPLNPTSVTLIEGNGTIFGAEMIANKLSVFTYSFSVLTKTGCKLRLSGRTYYARIKSQRSNIPKLLEFLEQRRSKARKLDCDGPVLLLAGQSDVGKSTLCHTILNGAIHQNCKPLFIDIDVGQSSTSLPGNMGIVPVATEGDVVRGFKEHPMSVHFFGYKSPEMNPLLYLMLIKKLGLSLKKRFQQSPEIKHSGAVIDTCGWVTGLGYTAILTACQELGVNVICAINDEDLFFRLQNDLPKTIDIQFIPELHGVVKRNRRTRILKRNLLIQDHFYGNENQLEPYEFDLNWSDIEVFRSSELDAQVKLNMLQDGFKYIHIIKESLNDDLLNQVLAISYANHASDEILTTSVMGFVIVKKVDLDSQTISVVSPNPAPLPNNIFLVGDIPFNG